MFNMDYNFLTNSLNNILTNLLKSKYLNNYICLCFFILIFCFLIFTIVSYYFVSMLKTSLDEYNLFFYQYNNNSQKILNNYGNSKINKIYLIRQPFNKYITFILNVLTGYQYNKKLAESKDYLPYHVFIVCEIKKGKKRKLLLVEKNNYINISDNFYIRNIQDTLTINVHKQKITLNTLLNITQKRMGSKKFFNWHPYKNNCHEFTKEILITIEKYNNFYKDFIFRDKMFQLITPSDFTLHIGYSLSFIHNIFSKYILDNSIFNHYEDL